MIDNNNLIISKQILDDMELNVYGTNENPRFLANEIRDILEHSNTTHMLSGIDADEKLTLKILMSGQMREMWFLTEDGLYELLLTSKKPIAKVFKKEVKSILKQLRTRGVVVMEHAKEEAITYEAKFGSRRIRKTFKESQDLCTDFEQFKELSAIEWKAKRMDNDDRIRHCGIIIDTLEQRLDDDIRNMRGSEVMAIQEQISDIKTHILILANRKHGGIKSGLTKKLKGYEGEQQ